MATAVKINQNKSRVGGKRPGAGRPKGAKNKLSREHSQTITMLAQSYSKEMLRVLVNIARDDTATAAARSQSAQAVIERGCGKAPQSIELSGPDGGPMKVQPVINMFGRPEPGSFE